MAPKSRFWRSGPPLEPSKPRTLSLETPPGGPQSLLWSSQAHPEPSQERSGAIKDHIKFTKLACSKPLKYHYLALRNLKKTLPDDFSMLQVPPRDPPERRPSSSRAPPGPPNVPWERPGPPQEPLRAPPGPPRAPLKILSWHHFFLKSSIFSFYTFFHVILTILQSVSLFVNVPLSAFTHISYVF